MRYSELTHDKGESNNVLLDAIDKYSVAKYEFTKSVDEDGTNEDRVEMQRVSYLVPHIGFTR